MENLQRILFNEMTGLFKPVEAGMWTKFAFSSTEACWKQCLILKSADMGYNFLWTILL